MVLLWGLRRLGGAIGFLLAATALCFLLAELAPGDPFVHLRLDAGSSPEALATLRARSQLDESMGQRYFTWLRGLLRGDWGTSLVYQTPVWPLLSERAGVTLGLTLAAAVAAWLAALPFALGVARRPGSWPDRAGNALAAGCLALPPPVIALGLLMLATEVGPAFSDRFAVLPAVLALALTMLPAIFRQARAALTEALGSPAVFAARARGLGEVRLHVVHGLRIAARPLLGLASLSFSGLLSASVAVEVIFGLPGLGALVLEGLSGRDHSLVTGGVLVSAAWVLAVQFAFDLLLGLADPRTRQGAP